jgi:guanosine-3',5'-bis(diphosphate) 3'-pyrophosphohydrolase
MSNAPAPTPSNRPLWQEAISFASRAHRNQVRRDDRTPYIAHCARVMTTISQLFECQDEALLAAAVLHDTIEDTTTDYEDIAHRFGTEVADLVAAMTKNMALPEELREAQYDAQLAKADWRARLIKLADTYDNLCDVETVPSERRARRERESAERARRAIVLAAPDRGRPSVDRAVAVLSALLSEKA